MMRKSGEDGIAMIMALLMMLLVSALLVGFTATIMITCRPSTRHTPASRS
jgi:type II secretory pathway component PulK